MLASPLAKAVRMMMQRIILRVAQRLNGESGATLARMLAVSSYRRNGFARRRLSSLIILAIPAEVSMSFCARMLLRGLAASAAAAWPAPAGDRLLIAAESTLTIMTGSLRRYKWHLYSSRGPARVAEAIETVTLLPGRCGFNKLEISEMPRMLKEKAKFGAVIFDVTAEICREASSSEAP